MASIGVGLIARRRRLDQERFDEVQVYRAEGAPPTRVFTPCRWVLRIAGEPAIAIDFEEGLAIERARPCDRKREQARKLGGGLDKRRPVSERSLRSLVGGLHAALIAGEILRRWLTPGWAPVQQAPSRHF
jgi:hypothetical protein